MIIPHHEGMSLIILSLALALFFDISFVVESFRSPTILLSPSDTRKRRIPNTAISISFITRTTRLHESSSDASDTHFLAELRNRQQQLVAISEKTASKWRQVHYCKSGTVLVLPDWVRRLDVEYPLIACGSASGEIFIGNLDTNKILTSTARGRNSSLKEQEESSSPVVVDDLLVEQTARVLNGNYDGGGTVAIAFQNKRLVDAPRTGGVRLHRVVKDKEETVKLIAQGGIPALEGVLVSCLELLPDYLLAGTADGRVQAYPLESETPLFLQSKPRYEWNLASVSFGGCSPVTSLSACIEINCVVAATAASAVQILSIPDDDDDDDDMNDNDEDRESISSRRQELQPVACFYPPFDSSERKAANAFCLSATVTKRVDENGTSYSIVCGGNDGSLYVQPLSVDLGDESTKVELALTSPMFPLRPFHDGAVVAVTSPAQSLVATAGQDGALRVYEVGSQTRYSRVLYQFAGYKVWVGSLCVADGNKLYTDGADNQVICHNFVGQRPATGGTNRKDGGSPKS